MIMWDGKKTIAEEIIYHSFDIVETKTGKPGFLVFELAIKNIAPLLELRSRRVGGANYQVPVPVSNERRQILALRWIRDICRKKKGKGMAEKLAEEIVLAANKEGAAMKKREEVHRMAEANKAFAHFA
jgi:small subunit ribosomal protein S7